MKKRSRLLVIAFYLLTLAIIIFFYDYTIIPKRVAATEAKIRMEIDENAMQKKKVAVVVGKEGISKYTELTDEIIHENITLIEIPAKYVMENSVFDIDFIRGKIPKEDLRVGEQIACDSLSEDVKWFEDYSRLKEYEVSGIVAGILKSGNIIDVIINYDNGEYDVVVPKIKVQKLIKKEDEDEQHIIVLAINEEQYTDLETAKKLGYFETRIYLDENQPSSEKTFDRFNH